MKMELEVIWQTELKQGLIEKIMYKKNWGYHILCFICIVWWQWSQSKTVGVITLLHLYTCNKMSSVCSISFILCIYNIIHCMKSLLPDFDADPPPPSPLIFLTKKQHRYIYVSAINYQPSTFSIHLYGCIILSWDI